MKEYYTAIIALTVGAMFIMQAAVGYNVALDRDRRRTTRMLFWVIIVTSVCEWMGVMLDGTDPQFIPFHLFVKTLELSLTPCIGLFCGRSLNKEGSLERVAVAFVVVNAVLEVLSVYTGLVFYVDEHNFYHHGPFYWIYTAFCIGTIGFFFLRGLEAFKRYQHSGGVLIWMVTLFLVTGIVVQSINSQIKVTWLTVGIAAVLLYTFYGDVIQQVDGLTELINRWGYENYISHFRGKGAILFLDVDCFKEVNDTYGHAAGDACLTTIAECLRETFVPYGKCFRLGGDEFCVLLEERQNEVEPLLQELAAEMAEQRKVWPYLPHISAGYTVFDTETKNINDAISEADAQMYMAKRKNHVVTRAE